MVEGAAFGCPRGRVLDQIGRVRDVGFLLVVHDLVAIAGNGVDIVETICRIVLALEHSMSAWIYRTPHAQLLESIYTAGLQQLANNAVRFLEALFQ